MVRVTDELALSPEHVSLYHAADPLLGHLPVLIFHGPSTTANYTHNSSRVQVHVLSSAGYQSYPRITISPSSPFYTVVNYLPREFQGDEVYRGLAFGLYRYFTELPDNVKTHLRNAYPSRGKRPGSAPALFGPEHAADLVEMMVRSENSSEVIATLSEALQTQHVSNVDIDFILPPGAIVPLVSADLEEVPDDEDDILDPTLRQYGGYTPLVKLFGEPVFLPTSKLRRAPSKPTPLNKNKTFTKDQKIELRMKLCELVDTEERYVIKVRELVQTVANDFRESAKKRQPGSLSPSEEELEKLFPKSADRILQVNSSFMDELRRIMDETEEDAAQDMDVPTINLMGSKSGGSVRTKDPLGALAIARLFLEWFPKFTGCYQDYIKASQHFPTLLNSFLDQQSSFRQRVNQAGEQTIRSILIEPVQRLPRYSLLIDQIVNSLPITHPALQPMLKARDIITNICSMDDPLPAKPHVASRLRNMIESWPKDFEPQGRLILAADFIEMGSPSHSSMEQHSDDHGIFLLFSDCLVLLRKSGEMTARDLLREVDKPSAAELLITMTNAAGGPPQYEFAFTGWHNLVDVRFTESADGHLVWMTSTQEMKGAHGSEQRANKPATSRCFMLQESFEGRAAKWTEDVIKARIEARFPESERENPSWTMRSVRMPENNLGIHAAMFQEGADQLVDGRREPAPIRVVVDHEKGTKGAPVGHYGVEIVVNVTTKNLKRVSILTVGLNGKQFQDDVALEDFLPTMSRRIMQLLSIQFNVSNRVLAAPMVSYYSKTLRSLSLSTRAEKTRSFLNASPVKLLSSLFTGGSNTSDASLSDSKIQRQASLHRADSHHSMYGSIKGRNGGDRNASEDTLLENPLVRLEQAFTGFTAAIQCRKGSIIGRTLLNRSMADELSVNDLYNRLIENPFDYEVANDVGTDVVFMAFENFLRIAWTEQMGPVVTIQLLDILEERANKRVPGEFADFVNFLFRDLAPQNRRAFTALIKLLADLLDGCGNDSDRGALTLAFAELLVADGSAAHYINLLDRLVDDCDRIFGESTINIPGVSIDTIYATIRGNNKGYNGSMASNTSSLRRKFGFDMLLRQNSKDDRSSMWRSLKHRGAGETASLSKASARSFDDSSLQKRFRQRRPTSRDRPHVASAFEEPSSATAAAAPRPTSSHRLELTLETIGEPAHEVVPGSSGSNGSGNGSGSGNGRSSSRPRRKRRSSLSDLKALVESVSIEEEGPQSPQSPAAGQQPLQVAKSGKVNCNPEVVAAARARASMSPDPTSQPASYKTQRQKENVTIVGDPYGTIRGGSSTRQGSPGRQNSNSNSNSASKLPRHTKTLSTSNIPTLKPASGRPGTSGSDPQSPNQARGPGSPVRTGAQKLRLQSPQKLRERLQIEKRALGEADAALQSELSKIGEEMARVSSVNLSDPQTASLRRLTSSVQLLEDRIPVMMAGFHERQEELQRDMEAGLRTSEAKMRAIDQLHKEAVAENELLYERFNGELTRIVRAIKGKGREDKEELVAKLRGQGEEMARMKKENLRLKRELVGLRAAMRGAE